MNTIVFYGGYSLAHQCPLGKMGGVSHIFNGLTSDKLASKSIERRKLWLNPILGNPGLGNFPDSVALP